MKRLFTTLTICAAAMSLIGCGNNYEQKARVWICDQVEHFVCLDSERHSLYYFDKHSKAYPVITKVDLDTYNTEDLYSITCEGGKTYDFDTYESVGLPVDKGYNGSESFALAVEDIGYPTNERQAGIIYNTYGKPSKLICQGFYVDVHNYTLFSSAYLTGSSISGVDVFDIEGKKLEPKRYRGSIARQDIIVELVEKDGVLAGSYYYTKYGPGKHRIYIFGRVNEEREFVIKGYNYYYNSKYNCEDWSGSFKDGVFDAEAYIHHTHRSHDFTLTPMI